MTREICRNCQERIDSDGKGDHVHRDTQQYACANGTSFAEPMPDAENVVSIFHNTGMSLL